MKFVIVGQGVAGTLLAFELERRGVDFHIIDSGKNYSSAIAAGIMNPVVFRRLTKSWMVDECWELAIKTYKSIEEKLDVHFFHSKPMRRLYASEQEADYWRDKTKRDDFSKYISEYPEEDVCPDYANNTFGCGLVNQVHHMDVQVFLNATRNYFELQGKLTTAEIDYYALQSELDSGKIAGVIYCQGYQNIENPYFKNLPVQTTKGQILTVEMQNVRENELLNRKCFMLPLGNNKFRVGATYEWENTTLHTTEEAQQEISEKLKSLIHTPFKVVEQNAGIRPTSPDRRPILGEHPETKKQFLLNGLGTKGYLLAPWCVQELCAHIFDGKTLHPEVDLNRFKQV
jgi:glycine/D-amino acid oxidase-like deaminating enzyme